MRINKESIDRWFDYDLHIESRTIYIGDGEDGSGVGPKMAEKVIKAFTIFNTTPDKNVRVILNSKGGDWYDGMAIYDVIKSSPCEVTIEVVGAAMSMGSIILQAADVRVLHPNSTIMIHDGSDFFDGHARNMERWGDWSKVIRKQMYAIYAEKTGKDSKHWEKRCGHDYILTAEEAVEEGLADKIYGQESTEE
jgi:ATP-dependent Clp endopeptidase proteolytic subunit ClpP